MTPILFLATFCWPNSSHYFSSLQHHVHICSLRHRRDYDHPKAVVVVWLPDLPN